MSAELVRVPRVVLEALLTAAHRASRAVGYIDDREVVAAAVVGSAVDLIGHTLARILGADSSAFGEPPTDLTPRQAAESQASQLEALAPRTVWRSLEAPAPSAVGRRYARGTAAPPTNITEPRGTDDEPTVSLRLRQPMGRWLVTVVALVVMVAGCVPADEVVERDVPMTQLFDGTAGEIVGDTLNMGAGGGAAVLEVLTPPGFSLIEFSFDAEVRRGDLYTYGYTFSFPDGDLITSVVLESEHTAARHVERQVDVAAATAAGERLFLSVVPSFTRSVSVSDFHLVFARR